MLSQGTAPTPAPTWQLESDISLIEAQAMDRERERETRGRQSLSY
jgi:hypothetical protein